MVALRQIFGTFKPRKATVESLGWIIARFAPKQRADNDLASAKHQVTALRPHGATPPRPKTHNDPATNYTHAHQVTQVTPTNRRRIAESARHARYVSYAGQPGTPSSSSTPQVLRNPDTTR